jgi:hypothetical protein
MNHVQAPVCTVFPCFITHCRLGHFQRFKSSARLIGNVAGPHLFN